VGVLLEREAAALRQGAGEGGRGVSAGSGSFYYGGRELAASAVGLARLVGFVEGAQGVAGGGQKGGDGGGGGKAAASAAVVLPPQALDGFLRAHAAESARAARQGAMDDGQRAAVARAYAALDAYLVRTAGREGADGGAGDV
jgi:hypothetical protein